MFFNLIAARSQILIVILPLFIAQYILATFALTRLALCRFPMKRYMVWNIVILFAFFVGSIVFLCYYYRKRKSEVMSLERSELVAKGEEVEVGNDVLERSELGKTDEESDEGVNLS